jgi:hypothetical protein
MARQRKPPYLRKEGTRGAFTIWIVDGAYIRTEVDEEFTNMGQHYHCSYIPKNELWIDQGVKDDEKPYMIEHLLVEYRLMAKGMAYDDALAEADKKERQKRRRSHDMRKLMPQGQTLPDPANVHDHLWKKLENGVSVWIVNGRLVRSTFDLDFTAGGHHHVYEFIPQDEIWIDDASDEKERGYFLLHEMHERNRMAMGEPYSAAHAESSRLELHCRQHPDELHDALAAEGWEE